MKWLLLASVLWLTACASADRLSNDEASRTGAGNTNANTNTNAGGESGEAAKEENNGAQKKEAKPKDAKPSGNEPPFAKVIEDATELGGFLKLYRKDDKVWIELKSEDFDRLFYLKSNLDRGIGEKRFFGGMMTYPAGVQGVVQFRKVGRTVQMLERNMGYTATPGTPEARAVARSFSDSLLSSAPFASQPHPERGSVLVEANALFVNDMPAAASALEQSYRQGYTFDTRHSYLADAKASADLLTFDVNSHYALSRIAMPPMERPHGDEPEPPNGAPSLPSVLTDVRSLFLGFHYSLMPLPETPMKPRLADERVGYFVTEKLDFTDNDARLPIVRLINRWRLEKKDPDEKNPNAALSEPVTPITFWLDKTIPLRYREPIREGVLEWNKAFERIGFKDAIRVEIEPDDATFSTSDLRRPSIRWLTTAKASFGGIGPSVVDPRTGEIFDADIGLDASQVRAVASIFSESISGANDETLLGKTGGASSEQLCMAGAAAMQEAQFGLSLLALRGDVVPEDAATQRFVFDYLKSVTMHEVGHTLGLRHNFHASTAYSETQLGDKSFTETHGLGGSIMEYLPWNLALSGHAQGAYQMTTLGPYDYWAIKYGYSVWPQDGDKSKGEEAAALAQIAQRGTDDPNLAYATDEDALPTALDPEVNTNDLGNDPLAYAQKRMTLSKELWARSEAMTLPEGTRYALLRRNFTRGMKGAEQAVTLASRYIGGATLRPARAGEAAEPLTPITAAKQRQALQFLARDVLSADSITFSPVFLRHLAASTFDKQNAKIFGAPPVTTDVAVDQLVLSLYKKALDPLLSERTAQRLLNNLAKSAKGDDALTLGELHATLRKAIWSELKSDGDIPLMRRNLQREYARRIAAPLLAVSPTYPADARALLRLEAEQLKADIEKRQSRARQQKHAKVTPETVAHLEDVRALLTQALQAPMMRITP
ncbi:MAG: zinc-dependent metalloprotease [Burkholderiales bacterium]|nr:zinc-dependent metalloprotease [Burkholderiales bacterium]